MPAELILRADDSESLLTLIRSTVAADGSAALLSALADKLNEHGARLDGMRAELSTQGRNIMATQAEVVENLRAVKGAVEKIGGETRHLLGKIDELKERLANADNADPAMAALASELGEMAQRIDAMVPDVPAPEPEPTPQPTPEPTPADPTTDGGMTDSAVR